MIMPRFRGMAKRPIQSTKHVIDFTSVALANTPILIGPSNITGPVAVVAVGAANADDVTLNNTEVVPTGSTINGIYLSLFFALDGNEAGVGSVPLLDWYIINDNGNQMQNTFDSANLPTPGATGSHLNKNKIIHEEKGLIGEKNDGSKMVFQGVIKFPKFQRRMGTNSTWKIAVRANFDSVLCMKVIYKAYQ